MDVDETSWGSIRQVNNGTQHKALMEFCSRQIPVPYLTANANNPGVKDFLDMMQEAVTQDRQEVARLLGKQLLEYSLATSGLELTEQTARVDRDLGLPSSIQRTFWIWPVKISAKMNGPI